MNQETKFMIKNKKQKKKTIIITLIFRVLKISFNTKKEREWRERVRFKYKNRYKSKY